MTPAARYAAAIAVLDRIIAGAAAEQALTTWGRGNRFAGSKDRAGIRDHVFDVLRSYRTTAALGGGQDGRSLVLGLLRQQGVDPAAVFGADTYAPPALSAAEQIPPKTTLNDATLANLPDWVWPIWQADLGASAMQIAQTLTQRAGVFLRVNLKRGTRQAAIDALAVDGIVCAPIDDIKTGLDVIENPRRIAQSNAFQHGLVELQDSSGQAAMLQLAKKPAGRVLDFCAGGGGKALALADLMGCKVVAHDIDPKRMSDIPARAARAGVKIEVIKPTDLTGTYDLVLCDAPCSGSGTWRRAPQAKMDITPDRLKALHQMQADVLIKAATYVPDGGRLAYATCSVLTSENESQITRFLDLNHEFTLESSTKWLPNSQQDGFFLATLTRRKIG